MPLSPYSLAAYAYDLPEAQIAQVPVHPPESARLMSVSLLDDTIGHGDFFSFPQLILPGTLMFLNDTEVLPARISHVFSIEHNGRVRDRSGEILYLNACDAKDGQERERFDAMVYPGDSFPIGATVTLGAYVFRVAEITYQGRSFEMLSENRALDMLLEHGAYPIPPYIEPSQEAQDQYQTEFAKNPGSLAAPTASLHFTKSLLERCASEAEASLAYGTLHVGIGTFKIINQDDIRDHTMHAEAMLVSNGILESIAQAKLAGRPVLAVGTTMVRYLESLLYVWPALEKECDMSEKSLAWWRNQSREYTLKNGKSYARPELFRMRSGFRDGLATVETTIFIYPGYQFGIVDEIVTNFHLPNSTLMPMIAAFAGIDRLKNAYETAKLENYRFYSFGDGMHLARRQIRKAI